MSKKTSSSTSSTSSSSSRSHSGISLNKVSFYTLVIAAMLYLVAMILSLLKVNATVVMVLQNIALAFMVIIVAILSWRYVAHRPMVWKVLYILVLLVIIACIIVPLVA